MKRKTLAILGSRSLDDNRVIRLLQMAVKEYGPSHIITSAECTGVSACGRVLAKVLSIPLIVHFVNLKHGPGKYEQRNKALLQETDFALLIHDGHSTGTINELLLCKKMKIKYKYIKLDILPEDSMQGITEEDIEFEEEEELWRTRQV